jgi:hypothetical protein
MPVFQQLQTDVVRAAEVGVAAQAIRLEQTFEDEILTTAVKQLASHRGDKVKQAQDLRELRELVRRDKRAVELLSNVLGSSSGVSLQNYVAWLWVGSNVSDMLKIELSYTQVPSGGKGIKHAHKGKVT